MKIRLGNIGMSSCKLTAVVLNRQVVTLNISGSSGVVLVGAHNVRVSNPYLATVAIEIVSLTPFTKYTYSVTQGGETLHGSFRTLPDNQLTPFSFIVGTCDGADRANPMDTFQTMRRTIQESKPPVLFMATIDDVHYCDTFTVNDANTGFQSTGKPQETANPEDYAIGWAASFGLFRSKGKWQLPDRQWVYRNLPHICSGGDHMIANNHCRGAVGSKYYFGCDRSPGGLEEIALTEWAAFYGNANPQPLRTGELYWGKEAGPVRMALADIQKHCVPYDPDPNGTGIQSDTPMLGQTQVDDIFAYLNTDIVPFKILFMESGFSVAGQSWLEWHRSEAEAWKQRLDAEPYLNGSNGSFVGIYGDNHSMHSISFDTFWAFCAGTLGDSASVGHALGAASFGWQGAMQYLWGSQFEDGDILIGGFLHVIVHADRNPQELEVNIINGGTGKIIFSRSLKYQATRNQMQ